MELQVSAQAAELRGRLSLGTTTGRLLDVVREVVPFAEPGDRAPHVAPLLQELQARWAEVGGLIAWEKEERSQGTG